MAYIQLSLYGRTSQELWYQETGSILEPSLNPFAAPAFQCLSLNGQMQEWCEGKNLSFAGESWTPNISQHPNLCKEEREYLLYAILEDIEPTKYYISPKVCTRILRLSQMAQIKIPYPIEMILQKQGGTYPISEPFKSEKCEQEQNKKTKLSSQTVSENQMSLFPLF